MAESQPKSVSTGKIATIVVLTVLVAAVTVLIIQNWNLRSEVAEGIQTEEELTAEIDNVEEQLKEFEFALNSKDLELEEKEQMFQAKEALIKEQEQKIANLVSRNRLSQQEAERLRGRVETLEFYVKKYENQITALKEELAARDATIASLQGDLEATADERDSIKDVNEYHTIQLEGAQKLKAHSFTFFRKKQSGAEVEESSFRASQMDEIKICFVIEENNTTKKGEKDVYLQILTPNGKLVKDDAKSGFFKYDGEDVQYTSKTKVKYEGERLATCLDVEQPSGYDYAEGMHKVLVYCEKRIIGKAEFEVK
jgi:DNA repair ATPase RecN